MPEKFEAKERQGPKELLLTPEQERAEAERRGEPPYIMEFREGEKKAIIYGSKHLFNLEGAKKMKELFEAEKPDVVLFEGAGIRDFERVEREKLDEAEIVRQYGEQGYMHYLAKKSDVEARSWDIPLKEQVKWALRKGNNPEAVIGAYSFYLARYNRQRGEPASAKGVVQLLKNFFNEELVGELKEEFGVDFAPDNFDLNKIAKKYAGVSFGKLTSEHIEEGASPRRKTPLSQVMRDTAEARDYHAIDVITEAKEKYKKVFITTGSSHALAWEPALKAIY